MLKTHVSVDVTEELSPNVRESRRCEPGKGNAVTGWLTRPGTLLALHPRSLTRSAIGAGSRRTWRCCLPSRPGTGYDRGASHVVADHSNEGIIHVELVLIPIEG